MMAGRNFSRIVAVHRQPVIQVSGVAHHHRSKKNRSHPVNKTKRNRIIHATIRPSRLIYPTNENSINHNNKLDTIHNYQNPPSVPYQEIQLSQSEGTSNVTNTSSEPIKEANSPVNRSGTADSRHRTLKKQKKGFCSRRCMIITIIIVVLLALGIAVILTAVLTNTKRTSTPSTPVSLRWNVTGTTVAGITGPGGTNTSQFSGPYGLAWDSSGSLYVADSLNNRVQKWIIESSTGVAIAGQANATYGNDSSHLYTPIDILLDSDDNLYVVERFNHRLTFWPKGASAGATIAGTSSLGTSNSSFQYPSAIVSDPSTNTFYITDTYNHRVMHYSFNASTGTVVAGGNGAGFNNTQLNVPIGMYFDALSNSLFIANFNGHTIVRWTLGDNYWTLVVGDINGINGSSSALLNGPVGITFDPMGNIYVADARNHRIQLFLAGQSTAVTIAGVTGVLGNNATLLQNPFWSLLDNQLNLYVADYSNNRVQKFNRY